MYLHTKSLTFLINIRDMKVSMRSASLSLRITDFYIVDVCCLWYVIYSVRPNIVNNS